MNTNFFFLVAIWRDNSIQIPDKFIEYFLKRQTKFLYFRYCKMEWMNMIVFTRERLDRNFTMNCYKI